MKRADLQKKTAQRARPKVQQSAKDQALKTETLTLFATWTKLAKMTASFVVA